MKKEGHVRIALLQKVGLYLAGNETPKLVEHIRQLDWVLIDGPMRSIEVIMAERRDETPERPGQKRVRK